MTEQGGLTRRVTQSAVGEVDIAAALDSSKIAAWHWDPRGGLHWSAGAAQALRVPEIVLRSPELLERSVESPDRALVARAVRRAWRHGGSVNARVRAGFGRGELRWFDVIGRVLRDEAGNPTGATGVAFEVTENHEAGEAILEALVEAEATLDRLRTLVGEWNPTGGVLTVARQPPGLTLVPIPPSRVPLADLLRRTGTRDAGRVRQAFDRSIDNSRAFHFDLLIRDDRGDLRRALLRGGPVGDPAETVWIALMVLD